MTDPDLDEEPAEHGRYRRYLQALDGVAETDEADLVTTVLRDPVMSMAQAAVNHHLERRAAQLLTDPAFTAWAQMMATAVADRSFLTRRLSEWTLPRAIALDEPWTAEDLTTASDWFQRTASTAQIVTSSEVLSLLAERGRTRRVRNARAVSYNCGINSPGLNGSSPRRYQGRADEQLLQCGPPRRRAWAVRSVPFRRRMSKAEARGCPHSCPVRDRDQHERRQQHPPRDPQVRRRGIRDLGGLIPGRSS
ncbi:hypothetical protein ACN24L_01425 [Streptomyces microflavus]